MTSLPRKPSSSVTAANSAPAPSRISLSFDPATVDDPSVYADPHHYATGFSDIIVNGSPGHSRDPDLTFRRPGESRSAGNPSGDSAAWWPARKNRRTPATAPHRRFLAGPRTWNWLAASMNSSGSTESASWKSSSPAVGSRPHSTLGLISSRRVYTLYQFFVDGAPQTCRRLSLPPGKSKIRAPATTPSVLGLIDVVDCIANLLDQW